MTDSEKKPAAEKKESAAEASVEQKETKTTTKQTAADPADPFANVLPTDPKQIMQGSVQVLELSSDAGETWSQIPVEKFHFFHGALEADIARPSALTIHPDIVFLARIISKGERLSQVWEGKTMQTQVKPDLIRLRVYSI